MTGFDLHLFELCAGLIFGLLPLGVESFHSFLSLLGKSLSLALHLLCRFVAIKKEVLQVAKQCDHLQKRVVTWENYTTLETTVIAYLCRCYNHFMKIAIALAPLILLQLVLLIVALIDLRRRPHVTGGNKVPWLILILLVSTFGPIIYLIYGRKDGA